MPMHYSPLHEERQRERHYKGARLQRNLWGAAFFILLLVDSWLIWH